MGHVDQHAYSVARTNANHFLTRPRLDDAELAEWIQAAYGETPAFQSKERAQAIAEFTQAIDAEAKKVFGDHMTAHNLGGMTLLLTQMVTNIEQAQIPRGQKLDARPPEIKQAVELVTALGEVAKGNRLNSIMQNRLNKGTLIMDALADYAREAALVLPVTLKSQDSRDRLRNTSHGMPAVDLKLCGIAREYTEHLNHCVTSR